MDFTVDYVKMGSNPYVGAVFEATFSIQCPYMHTSK